MHMNEKRERKEKYKNSHAFTWYRYTFFFPSSTSVLLHISSIFFSFVFRSLSFSMLYLSMRLYTFRLQQCIDNLFNHSKNVITAPQGCNNHYSLKCKEILLFSPACEILHLWTCVLSICVCAMGKIK